MFARLRCGGNLPQCLAFGTGVLGVLWWLGGWVVGIRYRRGPPMVRNMRAVPKTGSWGTRRIRKHSV
ncbi:unknown [Bacteroides sp. CAG:1060]|nr:unknown [Bacteroides sp. CAG:1060]